MVTSESQVFELLISDGKAHAVKSGSYQCFFCESRTSLLGFSEYVLPKSPQHICRLQPRGEMLRMSGYSGRELAVPSFTLHSFLQMAVAKEPEGSQSSQSKQLCTAGAHSISQSSGCGHLSAGHSSVGRHLQGR